VQESDRLSPLIELRRRTEQDAIRLLHAARKERETAESARRAASDLLAAQEVKLDEVARKDKEQEARGRRASDAVVSVGYRRRLQAEREALEAQFADARRAFEATEANEHAAEAAVAASVKERKSMEIHRDALVAEERKTAERREEAEADDVVASRR